MKSELREAWAKATHDHFLASRTGNDETANDNVIAGTNQIATRYVGQRTGGCRSLYLKADLLKVERKGIKYFLTRGRRIFVIEYFLTIGLEPDDFGEVTTGFRIID